ncbi:MAG: GNAT family N-acetyltransferase [Rhodobacterales bacterium]|nr:MAG: GNAT family N-acetyltransferase [Rhodobacterales bacterium]
MITWTNTAPQPEEYLALRAACELGERSLDAARKGLGGELFVISLRDEDGTLIGMLRLVGDGGVHALLSDMAVHPDHRGQGLAAGMLARLEAWTQDNLPDTCFISVIPNKRAVPLYEEAGFDLREGMGRYVGSR